MRFRHLKTYHKIELVHFYDMKYDKENRFGSSMDRFFGRKAELKALKELLIKRSASLVVIRGRRRIGKSRLIKEFAKDLPKAYFSATPPTKETTVKSQREDFARQMARELKIPLPRADDWGDLLWEIARQTEKDRHVVVIDEISWIASKDPTFLGKLKNAWDLHFSNNPKLILILCGSVSSWIEENILKSTAFFGRVSFNMQLKELPLKDCKKFWHKTNPKISSYEIFKVLAITGGIPFYLEQIFPEYSAEENIKRLCFQPEGVLFNEFDRIFNDLFSKKSALYRKIVARLAAGPATMTQIYETLIRKATGVCAEYMDDLSQAGFVHRDYTWSLKTNTSSNLSKFRLSDNYLRFYLKMIEPWSSQIVKKGFAYKGITNQPGWQTVLGLQFENLVLQNVDELYPLLGISPAEVVHEGPFFQRKTNSLEGCQIDLLIQMSYQCLYICEVKFSKNPIGKKVIDEVQKKIKALRLPRGFSIRTALIHVNGVQDVVEELGFFSKIIDFSEIL